MSQQDLFSGAVHIPEIWHIMFPLPVAAELAPLSMWELRTRVDWAPIIARLVLGFVCRGSRAIHWPLLRKFPWRTLLPDGRWSWNDAPPLIGATVGYTDEFASWTWIDTYSKRVLRRASACGANARGPV